jgi:ribosome-associated translation inhibitor RaiA
MDKNEEKDHFETLDAFLKNIKKRIKKLKDKCNNGEEKTTEKSRQVD